LLVQRVDKAFLANEANAKISAKEND